MNETSSRSHAIMILTLCQPDGAKGATMFLVDLAGSERVSRSGVTGKAFEEATNINQSLSALGAYRGACMGVDSKCIGSYEYS